MDYDEAIEWLYGTQLFGIKLGLEGTNRLFEELNLYDALKERAVFHVAGTNGKGSTCAMIDSICRVSGNRCGLFTSPHLISFRERIRVNGSMIPESEVAAILTQVRDVVGEWETHPTFFELAVTLAVKYFCQQEVEVLVMETGMGGRLDATNVLPASVSVITSVDLDHQQWLGENLEAIATEKAGIIKPGIPVITPACQKQPVMQTLKRVASKRNALLRKVESSDSIGPQEVGLKGRHQRLNAALAVEAVKSLWPELPVSVVENGLRDLTWPGRFDLRPGNRVIDGAHNPAAMAALVSTWREEFGNNVRATIVFAAADSKDTSAMLTELAAIAHCFVFVKLSAKRGVQTDALKAALSESKARKIPCAEASDVINAISQAQEEGTPILVTGSLFLAGEALALFEEQSPCFESSEQ